jgi:hypothetical protein
LRHERISRCWFGVRVEIDLGSPVLYLQAWRPSEAAGVAYRRRTGLLYPGCQNLGQLPLAVNPHLAWQVLV